MTAACYRVWCLSWDDSEEAGSDVVAYDIMNHDFESARRGAIYVPNTVLHSASDAAEAYADYAHDHRDGYECTWPLQFRVRGPEGSVQDFDVDRESVPVFTAHPARMPPALHVLWGGNVLCEHARLREVPGCWPKGQNWISLQDVANGSTVPSEQPRCEECWKRAPGLITGLRQIGADR